MSSHREGPGKPPARRAGAEARPGGDGAAYPETAGSLLAAALLTLPLPDDAVTSRIGEPAAPGPEAGRIPPGPAGEI
jgi:hypothetical protein